MQPEMNETSPQTMPVQKKKKSMAFFGILAVLLLFVLLPLAVLTLGTVYASQSNSDVPVFSSIVEKVEGLVVSDEKAAEEFQQQLSDEVVATLATTLENDAANDLLSDDLKAEDLERMIEDREEIESYKFDINMGIEMDQPAGNMGIQLVGATSLKDDKQLFQSDVDVDYTANGVTFAGKGEFRMINNVLYFRVDELPELGTAMESVAAYKGKWIKVDEETTKGLSDQAAGTPSTSTEDNKLDKEDVERLQRLIESDVFTQNIERLDDEVLDGVRTNCYRLSLDEEALKDLEEEIIDIYELEEEAEGEESITETLKFAEFEGCMGRKDGYIYRMNLSMDMEDTSSNGSGSGSFTMDYKAWDYNEDISVETPEGALDIQEVMTSLQTPQQQNLLDQQTLPSDYNPADYPGLSEDDLKAL